LHWLSSKLLKDLEYKKLTSSRAWILARFDMEVQKFCVLALLLALTWNAILADQDQCSIKLIRSKRPCCLFMGEPRFYYDPEKQTCSSHSASHCCHSELMNAFKTMEECKEAKCGSRGWFWWKQSWPKSTILTKAILNQYFLSAKFKTNCLAQGINCVPWAQWVFHFFVCFWLRKPAGLAVHRGNKIVLSEQFSGRKVFSMLQEAK